MDKTQRIVLILLILTIVISGVSIMVNLSLLNVDVPSTVFESSYPEGEGSGSLSFYVEENTSGAG